MQTKDWLRQAQRRLEETSISTARLDCMVLLEDCTQTDRAQLLAYPEQKLTAEQEKLLNAQIERRKAHEPLAYIRGRTEFYGREFIITHDVLEPRPESETMIDLLKSLAAHEPATIIDVGTGSGALAITAKLELPQTEVLATDIDQKCLQVAQKNAQKYTTDISFLQGDLLEPLFTLSTASCILLCNLPYVPHNFQINPAAMQEPKIAIFGGPDGLNVYRKLFKQIKSLEQKPLFVLTESLPPQHEQLCTIAQAADYRQELAEDFIQVFKAA